jgi:hypothetical protein
MSRWMRGPSAWVNGRGEGGFEFLPGPAALILSKKRARIRSAYTGMRIADAGGGRTERARIERE